MKFACDRCQTRYMIPDEKVRPGGVKVRCKKCEHIIVVKPPARSAAVPRGGPKAAGRAAAAAAPSAAASIPARGAGSPEGGAMPRSGGEGGRSAGGEADGLDAELGAAFESMVVGGAKRPEELEVAGDASVAEGARPQGCASGDVAAGDLDAEGAAAADDAAAGTASAGAAAATDRGAHANEAAAKASASAGEGAAAAGQPAGGGGEGRRRERLPDPDVEWFLAIRDEQVGPVKLEELLARWERAEIGPDTLCWRSGLVDWTPLSQLDELAALLAPRPARGGSAGAAAAAGEAPTDGPRREPWDNTAVGTTAPQAEEGWRPSAASALSDLVQRELSAAEKAAPTPTRSEGEEEPQAPAPENTGIRMLLRNLPEEAPAQEPSRFIPLQARPAAGGAAQGTAPVVAAGEARARERRSGRSPLLYVVGGVLLALPLVAAGAWLGGAFSFMDGQAPAAEAQQVQAPPAPPQASAAEPEQPPAEAEALAAASGGSGGAAARAEQKEGEGSEEAEAVADAGAKEPAAEAEAEAEEPPKASPPKKEEPVKVAARPRRPRPQRQATAAAAPKREAPRQQRQRPARQQRSTSGSGDLLAPGSRSSIDDLFDREFSSESAGANRSSGSSGGGSGSGSTYIPPAPGGGAPLPAQLGQGDITAVVFGQRAELQRCAAAYKASGGASSGTVVMRWIIEPNGSTSGIKPVKGAEHAQFANCVGELVKTWRFPAYSGPRMQPIDFPFSF